MPTMRPSVRSRPSLIICGVRIETNTYRTWTLAWLWPGLGGASPPVYTRGAQRGLLLGTLVVTVASCLGFSICALDGYSSCHTRPQGLPYPRHIPSLAWVLLQLGGASSGLDGPDPLSRRFWYEGPHCPGQIKEQRPELGQAWACCLPIRLGTPARPKAERGFKGEGTQGSVRVGRLLWPIC